MRIEVKEALEQAQKRRDKPVPSELRSPPDPGIDYSRFLTDEDKARIDRMFWLLKQVSTCLQRFPDAVNVYAGSASAITVHCDETETNLVVIEFSFYGPLAAVFAYGSVPGMLLDTADKCIANADLIKLTASEVEELERTGQYLDLFE